MLCEGDLALKDIVYIPCGNDHLFCKVCFTDSLTKRGPRCPICDTAIQRKKEFPIPDSKRCITITLLCLLLLTKL